MNQSFDENGLQFAWDATSISLAGDCAYKYYLVMYGGWIGQTLSFHIRFGAHYATALEHYHHKRAEGVNHYEAMIYVVREALIDTWDYEESKPNVRNTTLETLTGGQPWNSMNTAKNRETLIRTIIWYLETFGEEEDMKTIILSDGSPAVEYTFALPVDDDLLFTGHIDRLVEYTNHPFAMDQKTTGITLTPRYFEQFSPHNQMSMYSFAGRIIYGAPIKGVIIDAAQIAVGFSRFARGFTFRSEAQLDEWYDDTLELIHRTRKLASESRFPKNPEACGKYGGCQFREICSRDPSVRLNFLKGSFVQQEPWDPLRKR